MPLTLAKLRRFAVARSLFQVPTILEAVERLGFVQADPIRAPARAQDLTLRQRVSDYRAGDLERAYPALPIEEEYFINYGFMPDTYVSLMHPRVARRAWDRATKKRAAAVLEFVREKGEVHPRDVDAHFAHGSATNYWGGSSNVTTQLLDGMHYRGMLRVTRRVAGIRVYAIQNRFLAFDGGAGTRRAAIDAKRNAEHAAALIRLVVDKYAPVSARSLSQLSSRLRLGAPQLATSLKSALGGARRSLPNAVVDGVTWYWSEGDDPSSTQYPDEPDDRVRLLAPFDPVVWDRSRFEAFWDWAYRFEAYTPARKRKLGYYALPLLWRDQVLGWGNLSVRDGELAADLGSVSGSLPKSRIFKRELAAELERMRVFLVEPSVTRSG